LRANVGFASERGNGDGAGAQNGQVAAESTVDQSSAMKSALII